MKTTTLLFVLLLSAIAAQCQLTEILPAEILQTETYSEITGSPKLIDSPYGKAVWFDGLDDGLWLDQLPLKDLTEFTVEMIFSPDSIAAPFEQRILHVGEARGDRMLLELRAVDGNWYFDGYAASGTNKKALIDENLTHPLGKWYHVAFVVSPGRLTTFVNGKQELSQDFTFLPIQTGAVSIGTRIDKRSWFKGAVYKIRISPKQLKPKEFMTF